MQIFLLDVPGDITFQKSFIQKCRVFFCSFFTSSMLYFWVVLVCPGDTPGVRLCFRNIFSVGDIVTDAHLTMYSVLFPSLFSHTYYSSLSLLQMHKLHSPILYLSLLLLRMHNLHSPIYVIFLGVFPSWLVSPPPLNSLQLF